MLRTLAPAFGIEPKALRLQGVPEGIRRSSRLFAPLKSLSSHQCIADLDRTPVFAQGDIRSGVQIRRAEGRFTGGAMVRVTVPHPGGGQQAQAVAMQLPRRRAGEGPRRVAGPDAEVHRRPPQARLARRGGAGEQDAARAGELRYQARPTSRQPTRCGAWTSTKTSGCKPEPEQPRMSVQLMKLNGQSDASRDG